MAAPRGHFLELAEEVDLRLYEELQAALRDVRGTGRVLEIRWLKEGHLGSWGLFVARRQRVNSAHKEATQ